MGSLTRDCSPGSARTNQTSRQTLPRMQPKPCQGWVSKPAERRRGGGLREQRSSEMWSPLPAQSPDRWEKTGSLGGGVCEGTPGPTILYAPALF